MADYGDVIDFSGLDAALDIAKLGELLKPSVEAAMQAAKGQIVRLLPDGASGNLRRAPQAIAVLWPDRIEGQVFIQEDNPAYGYAWFVEHGRAPGKYPPWGEGTSLFKWASRKLTSGKYKATGKVVRQSKALKAETLGFSFLVARKIAKFGTKGQFPFMKGWAAAEMQVMTILEKGVIEAVEQL
jgi:hypothetical protein